MGGGAERDLQAVHITEAGVEKVGQEDPERVDPDPGSEHEATPAPFG